MKSAVRRNGFTLPEMLTTVALIGILLAIAVPTYQDYIRRAHRVDAQNPWWNWRSTWSAITPAMAATWVWPCRISIHHETGRRAIAWASPTSRSPRASR